LLKSLFTHLFLKLYWKVDGPEHSTSKVGPNKEKETVMRVYGNPQAECQVQKLKRWTESYMPLLLQLSKPSLKAETRTKTKAKAKAKTKDKAKDKAKARARAK
jgi:hypothetical protein